VIVWQDEITAEIAAAVSQTLTGAAPAQSLAQPVRKLPTATRGS
jgi:hypothetical protein